MRILLNLLIWTMIACLATVGGTVQAQQPIQPQQAQDVPVIDGEAGPCSVEFTVLDNQAKPVYSALIKVHIAYGLAGMHKLDLSAYTDFRGKVKFIGLPARIHKPPLDFNASKELLVGVANWNPVTECQGKHDIVLDKKLADR